MRQGKKVRMSKTQTVVKKPYVKPTLRRLGSVRELTHGHPSTGQK